MVAIDPKRARQIIESLRAGVPCSEASDLLTVGRESVLSRINEDLQSVAKGNGRHLIVDGPYGEGKTHLLLLVRKLALEQRMPVGSVVLSRENPLHKLLSFYQSVVRSIHFPERETERGIATFLHTLESSSALDSFLAWAEEQIHERFAATVRAIRQPEIGQETLVKLYQELSGEPMPTAELRTLANYRGGRRFNRFAHYPLYLRAWDEMFSRIQYQGFVLLIDEAELLQGFSHPSSRERIFLQLANLCGLTGQSPLQKGYVVISFASSYFDFLDLKNEPQRTLDVMARKERPQSDCELVEKVVAHLREARVRLEPIAEPAKKQQLVDQVIRVYQQAYPLPADAQPDRAALFAKTEELPVRTLIRTLIQALDLLLQYPGEDPFQQLEPQAPDSEDVPEFEKADE